MYDYKLTILKLAAAVCCLSGSSLSQTPGLAEKQAVTKVQEISVSELDAELPARPFGEWFRQVVGPQAGVNWQINECGEQPALLLAQGRELPACAEVNGLLPDGRKAVVMIEVGTFKKGIAGPPRFFHAAIEHQGDLIAVRRLRDLDQSLREPARLAAAERTSAKLAPFSPELLRIAVEVSAGAPGAAANDPTPPPPPKREPPRKISEGVAQGAAITKVQPLYPSGARRVNASGTVEVQVTISEAGRVTQARAISGHPLLRRAAVDAALKWVFNPTTLNQTPIPVQSVLTFVFSPTE
jgi:TonB family protein